MFNEKSVQHEKSYLEKLKKYERIKFNDPAPL